jgi:hypothetical protein
VKRTLSFVLLLSACGGAQAGGEEDSMDPSRFYPMTEGNVWTYDVDTGVGPPALGISRVTAVQGGRASISNNDTDPIVYEKRPEGIYRVGSDTWLLRRPLEVGARWPAAGGREAEVVSVTRSVEVGGGSFEGCLEIRESDGRQSVVTVYCPDVGPVIVETSMQMDTSAEPITVRGELRAYQLAE